MRRYKDLLSLLHIPILDAIPSIGPAAQIVCHKKLKFYGVICACIRNVGNDLESSRNVSSVNRRNFVQIFFLLESTKIIFSDKDFKSFVFARSSQFSTSSNQIYSNKTFFFLCFFCNFFAFPQLLFENFNREDSFQSFLASDRQLKLLYIANLFKV